MLMSFAFSFSWICSLVIGVISLLLRIHTPSHLLICAMRSYSSYIPRSHYTLSPRSAPHLQDVAAAINKGLLMSPSEKLRRQEKLYKVVTTHTSHTWAAVLVKMLLGSLGGQNEAKITPYLPTKEMKEGYEKAGKSGEKGKRLFLFDYDGTLSPIVKTPSMAIPSPSTLLALRLLSSDPQNLVYIISGRDGAFLEQHLGHLDGIGFSAEHGGFWKERGKREWENFTESLDMSWMRDVEEVFRYYTERTAGSHVEVKKSSVVWHWRESDPEWG